MKVWIIMGVQLVALVLLPGGFVVLAALAVRRLYKRRVHEYREQE